MDDSKVEAEVVLSSKRGTKEQVTLETATADVDVLLDASVVTDARKVVPPAPSAFSSQHGQLLLRGPEPTKVSSWHYWWPRPADMQILLPDMLCIMICGACSLGTVDSKQKHCTSV
jgi:hypothetical protein